MACITAPKDVFLDKYESLTKCLRVIAYCLRFINNVRKNNTKLTGLSILEELENTTLKLIKIT